MTRRIRNIDWPIAPLTPEDLPAGNYLASYRDWERRLYFKQPKIRLEFVIVEPASFAGIRVSLYATCKEDPNRRSSRVSKYYQLWVQAHGSPPQRGQRMTPSVFRGYWQVRGDWGHHKETGEPTLPIVAELLEHVAGEGVV